MAKIGTSLSSCLRSILRGDVDIADVAFIATSTAYPNRETMVEQVRLTHMGRDVEAHVANACELWDSGRIFQPSVRPDGRYAPDNWVEVPGGVFLQREAVA
jgi:hypothetical protein